MDYSAANTDLWNSILQISILAVTILAANVLRRKVPFIRKSLMPTAVLAGFLMLFLKLLGVFQNVAVLIAEAAVLGIGNLAGRQRTKRHDKQFDKERKVITHQRLINDFSCNYGRKQPHRSRQQYCNKNKNNLL